MQSIVIPPCVWFGHFDHNMMVATMDFLCVQFHFIINHIGLASLGFRGKDPILSIISAWYLV